MTDLILVHGVNHQQDGADAIEARWLPCLASGVRTAGFPEIADRLTAHAPAETRFRCRAAYYGNLFTTPGIMGAGETLTPVETILAEQIAREWLERAAADAPSKRDREAAAGELARLDAEPVHVQGVYAYARSAMAAVARLPWMGRLGLMFAQTFLVRNLKQVTRYLTDDSVREAAQQSVLSLLTPETRVIVAHSLGSIVAYEALHRLTGPLPLLVTIGSPLGLRGAIYERLRPQPPTYPPHLLRWTNVADRNDLVAAEPDLAPSFGGRPPGARFEAAVTVNNEGEPHKAEFYLTKPEVGRPIAETFG